MEEEKMGEEKNYLVIIPSCRGQMVYTDDSSFHIVTIKDTLNNLQIDESIQHQFNTFLRDKVKYISFAAPGVCGYGVDPFIHIIQTFFYEIKEDIDKNLENLLVALRKQTSDIFKNSNIEIQYQTRRGIPSWSKYHLCLNFPDKIQRFFPRTDIDREPPPFFLLENNINSLTENKITTLTELLFEKFSSDPTKKIYFFDGSCSKLAKIKVQGEFDSEIDDDSRLLNFTNTEKEIPPLNYILPNPTTCSECIEKSCSSGGKRPGKKGKKTKKSRKSKKKGRKSKRKVKN